MHEVTIGGADDGSTLIECSCGATLLDTIADLPLDEVVKMADIHRQSGQPLEVALIKDGRGDVVAIKAAVGT